ncbi:MAG: hypothetical protein QGD94_04135 [Planctomycetia bacterium]|nr:hypothetical protein [Planctomycetia bacterium]
MKFSRIFLAKPAAEHNPQILCALALNAPDDPLHTKALAFVPAFQYNPSVNFSTRTTGNLPRLTTVAIVLLASAVFCAAKVAKAKPTTGASAASVAPRPATGKADKKPANYGLIKAHLLEHYEGYVKHVAPASSTLKKKVKRLGTKAVALQYVDLESFCLDLAAKFKDAKVPPKEYKSLARKLSAHQKRVAGDLPIDYNADAVLKAYETWATVRTGFFRTLLRSPRAGSYRKLVRSNYSAEKFKKFMRRKNDSREKLYDSFVKSLDGFLARIFGPKRVNAVRLKGRQFNTEATRKIYDFSNKPKTKKVQKKLNLRLLKPKK